LFPEERCEELPRDASVVRLRLKQLRLCRPRQWGGCWLALKLWEELQLDRFWLERLTPSRKGTRWEQVLDEAAARRKAKRPHRIKCNLMPSHRRVHSAKNHEVTLP
jgi:hypothetical protein